MPILPVYERCTGRVVSLRFALSNKLNFFMHICSFEKVLLQRKRSFKIIQNNIIDQVDQK